MGWFGGPLWRNHHVTTRAFLWGTTLFKIFTHTMVAVRLSITAPEIRINLWLSSFWCPKLNSVVTKLSSVVNSQKCKKKKHDMKGNLFDSARVRMKNCPLMQVTAPNKPMKFLWRTGDSIVAVPWAKPSCWERMPQSRSAASVDQPAIGPMWSQANRW